MDETKRNAESMRSSASDKVRAVLSAVIAAYPNSRVDERDLTGVWTGAVGDLSTNQIRHGIGEMAKSPDKFSPSPGQFRALCIRAPYHADQPALPRPQPDRSYGVRVLSDVLKGLRR
jgi:hypothetical protein